MATQRFVGTGRLYLGGQEIGRVSDLEITPSTQAGIAAGSITPAPTVGVTVNVNNTDSVHPSSSAMERIAQIVADSVSSVVGRLDQHRSAPHTPTEPEKPRVVAEHRLHRLKRREK